MTKSKVHLQSKASFAFGDASTARTMVRAPPEEKEILRPSILVVDSERARPSPLDEDRDRVRPP